MPELVGHAGALGWVALKAALLFILALAAFRVGERRTVAQLSPFDFVVAVALGAIIGRTATSSSTSFLDGAVALLTLLLTHRIITALRRHTTVTHIVDQPPNVLIVDGELKPGGLARAGLTPGDVYALLRQHDVGDVSEVAVLLYETRGGVSLHRAGTPPGPLMRDALRANG
ncbi:MAG: YetF domain-containing protein [Jatrophihabitans sp.]